MIHLYGNASPNVVKVLLMLEETGLPYEQRWIDQYKDEQFESWYVALNPNRTKAAKGAAPQEQQDRYFGRVPR